MLDERRMEQSEVVWPYAVDPYSKLVFRGTGEGGRGEGEREEGREVRTLISFLSLSPLSLSLLSLLSFSVISLSLLTHTHTSALGTPVRAFLEDTAVWKQFGFHNTFRTLFISEITTCEEMSQMLVTKLTRGMTPQQTATICQECKVKGGSIGHWGRERERRERRWKERKREREKERKATVSKCLCPHRRTTDGASSRRMGWICPLIHMSVL